MFCLPLTEDQFNKDKENCSKDFVRVHLSKENAYKQQWAGYYREVVLPYQKLKKQFEPYGFKFNESVTLSLFTELIKNYEVNILFSHCKADTDEEIEFFDRLVPIDEFVDAIPLEYNKIIDLSVCKPEQAAKKLRQSRKYAIVKSVNKPINLFVWLYIYALTFEIVFNNQAKSYPDAIEQTFFKLYSYET